mmetsp:Transcript_53369/g.138023  ORF Transcript_53369/g.138023 Transcript_53369/m.138023 type:complete len:208 (-) Transcript_53369:97-720(-)
MRPVAIWGSLHSSAVLVMPSLSLAPRARVPMSTNGGRISTTRSVQSVKAVRRSSFASDVKSASAARCHTSGHHHHLRTRSVWSAWPQQSILLSRRVRLWPRNPLRRRGRRGRSRARQAAVVATATAIAAVAAAIATVIPARAARAAVNGDGESVRRPSTKNRAAAAAGSKALTRPNRRKPRTRERQSTSPRRSTPRRRSQGASLSLR